MEEAAGYRLQATEFRNSEFGRRKAKSGKNLCDLGVSAVKHQWMVEFFFTAEAQRARREAWWKGASGKWKMIVKVNVNVNEGLEVR